jgi:hypothetical protein
MHPFFLEIKHFPHLVPLCNMEWTDLPEPFCGKNRIKAILLGADPTNDGIKDNKGLKELSTVFGIGSDFEEFFFGPQMTNLKAINLTKDDLYVQNVCRNYFTEQTTQNNKWQEFAAIWMDFLKEELDRCDPKLPVLVTAEKILKSLIPFVPSAEDIYKLRFLAPFYSEKLKRYVFPMYRHPKYMLARDLWQDYREHIKRFIK